jgi:hypothetical protein
MLTDYCCVQWTGGDLYEELKRLGGQFPEGRTAGAVLAPCLEGLAYLHAQVDGHDDNNHMNGDTSRYYTCITYE